MSLSFVPLGVGDAFSARWYSSCVALEHDGRWILVDCPHPIRKMLAEASEGLGERLDLDRIEAVVLTHLHADHCSGLEGYGFYSFFLLGRRAVVAAHPDVSARLWDGHLAAGMERLSDPRTGRTETRRLKDYFELVDLAAPRTRIGPFTIETRRTRHHVPTTALRIEAGGRTLGLSADTSFDPGLVEWLGEADRFVHETNHGIHTPYASLAALPASVRARMWLIHYPDDFDREASVIEPLEQGRRYRV